MKQITAKQAKQIDEKFDIVNEKNEVKQIWTTPEADYGFGYNTASFINNQVYDANVYSLILDGELSDVVYAIYTDGENVALEPMHWYED